MNRVFPHPHKSFQGAGKHSPRSPVSEPARTARVARNIPESRQSESGDLISLYMREIGQTPLLKPEEESELIRRMREGDSAARERLIHAHLRLVVKLARGFEGWGLALLDLISEGNLGLMRAVDRFDPK